MCSFVNYCNKIDLNNFTLIIPSVSVGNVGQLTVDLLIPTYNLKKIATFWHPAIISSVGSDPFDNENTDVCVACELYANENLQLAAIQLRTSLEFRLALSFFEELKQFISENKFRNVIITTSSFAHLLVDPKSVYYYLSNEENQQVLKDLEFKLLKPVLDEKYIVEGSGFALKLYEILKDSLKCTVLVKHVSEGDNRNDATTMLNVLQKLIVNLEDKSIIVKFPHSWEFVFGNPSPFDIF